MPCQFILKTPFLFKLNWTVIPRGMQSFTETADTFHTEVFNSLLTYLSHHNNCTSVYCEKSCMVTSNNACSTFCLISKQHLDSILPSCVLQMWRSCVFSLFGYCLIVTSSGFSLLYSVYAAFTQVYCKSTVSVTCSAKMSLFHSPAWLHDFRALSYSTIGFQQKEDALLLVC